MKDPVLRTKFMVPLVDILRSLVHWSVGLVRWSYNHDNAYDVSRTDPEIGPAEPIRQPRQIRLPWLLLPYQRRNEQLPHLSEALDRKVCKFKYSGCI